MDMCWPESHVVVFHRQQREFLCRVAFFLGSGKRGLGFWQTFGQQKIVRKIGLIGAAEQILLIPSEVGEDLLCSAEFLHRGGVYRLFT